MKSMLLRLTSNKKHSPYNEILTYLSKHSCFGSLYTLSLEHNLKTKYPKWFAVICTVTEITWPVLYHCVIVPVAYFPPGASWCLGC